MIRQLAEADHDWVMALWKPYTKLLGPGSTAWWRSWSAKKPNDHWIGVDGVVFAHYLTRRDGVNVLYEIAVAEAHQRKGVAEVALRYIGFPMELKTDQSNAKSNAFYQKLGFKLVGVKAKKSNGELMNVYRKL